MTDKQPRQCTGNHPDPLAETFLITAAQLEELTTHAANASSGACHGSTTREKAAWKLFDSVVKNVKAQPLVGPQTERYAEAAFNEGWRDREARGGRMQNSRALMHRAWLESNARDAILEGLDPDEH